ncbi:MAG: hypothetical protein ACI4R9_05015 [Kiritimatiellia bacterium]
MKGLKHILIAGALGVMLVAAGGLAARGYARHAYGTLRARLRCGSVLTVETSAQKRTLGGDLVFCGLGDGRPYLLVGPSVDDLRALPIGDGGRPAFIAQAGNRFTLDCTDRIKTVTVIGEQCRVEDR